MTPDTTSEVSLPDRPPIVETLEPVCILPTPIEEASVASSAPPDYPTIAVTSESGEQLAFLKPEDTRPLISAATEVHRVYHTDFIEERYIGSGAWGFVHLARHKATGIRVAIKSVRKEQVQGKEDQLIREMQTLRAVAGQKGCLELVASFQDYAYFYFVTVSHLQS